LNADRLSAFFWLILGGGGVWGSISLGLGTTREPGSGFLSFLASGSVCLMALIIFAQSLRKKAETVPTISALWSGLRWKRPLGVGFITLGYILVFNLLGFAVTTFLFLIVLFRGLETLAWKKSLWIALISTSFTYLLLRISLEASLPKGIFGF